jgi:hypothetical protein
MHMRGKFVFVAENTIFVGHEYGPNIQVLYIRQTFASGQVRTQAPLLRSAGTHRLHNG